MELVLPKILHDTSFAASPSVLSIGFALVAALAGLLGIFLRRPKKAALPVFKVEGDVVKALEDAHEAVCIARHKRRESVIFTPAVSGDTVHLVNGWPRSSGLACLRH